MSDADEIERIIDTLNTGGLIDREDVAVYFGHLTARIAELEKRLTWQPIDETTPKDVPIIVAVMNTYSQTWTIGEAYWNDTDNDWWWANVSSGDYTGDSILNMNGPVEFWQPMPVAPVARTTLEASERGGA